VTTAAETKTYAVIERIREQQGHRLRHALRGAMNRAYAAPPRMPLADWADKYRRLSPEAAAMPGKWRTSNEPMARGVMNAMTEPLVEKVTAMCAAQILKTEFLLNTAGYYIHGDPAPILMVQPTVEMGEAFSKDRVAPMIRDTPVLRKLITSKSRDSSDTILQKAFPGGRLTITGANAPASLASRPIRIVLCDEVDRYPASAGREGDPVGLAEKRTTTFFNRKIALVSTPTVKGESRIEASYQEGDQRKFFVPCPHCGVRQVIEWAGVKWSKNAEGEHDPDTAHYECRPDAHDPETGEFGCGAAWSEAQRQDAIDKAGELENGGWIATKPFKGHASFHASQLASKRIPLSRIVKEFLEAKPFPDRLKTWTNTVLAETWEEGGMRADPDSLFNRREDYEADPLPAKVGFITAAVDIQDNRFEAEIVGWGEHEENWSSTTSFTMPTLRRRSFGKRSTACSCGASRIRPARPSISRRRASTPAATIRRRFTIFAGRVPARRVFAIKGRGGPGIPIWPKKATRNVAKKTDVFILGVDQAKSVVQARLMIAGAWAPGYCHFRSADAYDSAYFDGLTVEKAITKYKFGRPYKVWECPPGKRNEPWDCRVYAYAALKSTTIDIAARLSALNQAR
jgi:phage terminase large subunit GpA-like protein